MSQAAFRVQLLDLISRQRTVLARVEWAGRRQGMGSGPMGSGEDGLLIPACPLCQGIHPEKGKHEFIESALGHREGCDLERILRDTGPRRST